MRAHVLSSTINMMWLLIATCATVVNPKDMLAQTHFWASNISVASNISAPSDSSDGGAVADEACVIRTWTTLMARSKRDSPCANTVSLMAEPLAIAQRNHHDDETTVHMHGLKPSEGALIDTLGSGNHSQRCASKALQTIKRSANSSDGIQKIMRYLSAVYRDEEGVARLGRDELVAIASQLGWRYHFALQPPSAYSELSCAIRLDDWDHNWDQCPCTEDGIEAMFFKPEQAVARLNIFGAWLPAAVPRCQRHPPFVADGGYVEVLRIGGKITRYEHGLAGCWYSRVRGSGIFLPVGRSLRVRTRLELAVALGLDRLNQSELQSRRGSGSWREIRSKMDGIAPWILESAFNLCAHVRRRGYETVQLGWDEELCFETLNVSLQTNQLLKAGRPCAAEIISCHIPCLSMKPRTASVTACIPGMPLRTGLNAQLECICNSSQQVANCDLTSRLPSVLSASERQSSLVSAAARGAQFTQLHASYLRSGHRVGPRR